MPRQDLVLSVFVASPSDTEEERLRLEEVILEINNTWSRETGVRLELVKWETHALPGLGIDAQDVINRQIDDDYDIFVGVMWQRFGTPTQRYKSGTAEEFYRAKARYDNDPGSVRVMFYFKEAPVVPSRLDLDQMHQVQEFRKSLGVAGTLFWAFDDVGHFEKLVRIHLQRVIQDWQNPSRGLPAAVSARPQVDTKDDNEEEERGVLDYIIEFMDRFSDASQAMASTNALMEEATEKLNRRGHELTGLAQGSGQADYKEAKRIITAMANELLAFEQEFRSHSDQTLGNFEAGVDAMIRFVEMQPSFTSDDEVAVLGLIQQMDAVQGSIRSYSAQLSVTENATTAWPRVTKELNVAKRRLKATMGEVIARYAQAETLIHELKQALFDLVRRGSTEGQSLEDRG